MRWLLNAIAYCSSASVTSLASDLMTLSFLSTILSNVWLRISKSFLSSLDLASRIMLRHWWFSLNKLNLVAFSSLVSLSWSYRVELLEQIATLPLAAHIRTGVHTTRYSNPLHTYEMTGNLIVIACWVLRQHADTSTHGWLVEFDIQIHSQQN